MTIVVPPNSIFISVANGLAKNQEDFVNSVESLLVKLDFHPITLGRNTASNVNTLDAVRTIVSGTLGTLVIAFARLQIEVATEFPDSPHSAKATPRRLCTVWNQIEAAMTFQIGHPLLILAEESLYREGLLEPSVGPVFAFDLLQEAHRPQAASVYIEEAVANWASKISLSARR